MTLTLFPVGLLPRLGAVPAALLLAASAGAQTAPLHPAGLTPERAAALEHLRAAAALNPAPAADFGEAEAPSAADLQALVRDLHGVAVLRGQTVGYAPGYKVAFLNGRIDYRVRGGGSLRLELASVTRGDTQLYGATSGAAPAVDGKTVRFDHGGGLVERPQLKAFGGAAYCVAWSPDGRTLAVGGKDGRIRLIDGDELTELLDFRAHDDYVFSLAWTPDGSRLVSCSGDRTARVWDARTPRERRADQSAWEERVEAARALGSDELEARFAAAKTPDERAALLRMALERRGD